MSGAEELVAQSLRGSERRLLTGVHDDGDPFAGSRSACAIALHLRRPLISAGGQDLRTAPLVGNLQYMSEHPDIGENHNAAVFRWCYRRIGELIPELVDASLRPRVMLECSGTLLHGLRRIGADDVLDVLRAITVDGRYLGAVGVAGTSVGTSRGAVDAGRSVGRPSFLARAHRTRQPRQPRHYRLHRAGVEPSTCQLARHHVQRCRVGRARADIRRRPCHRSDHGQASFVWGQPEPISGQSNPRILRSRPGLHRPGSASSIGSRTRFLQPGALLAQIVATPLRASRSGGSASHDLVGASTPQKAVSGRAETGAPGAERQPTDACF